MISSSAACYQKLGIWNLLNVHCREDASWTAQCCLSDAPRDAFPFRSACLQRQWSTGPFRRRLLSRARVTFQCSACHTPRMSRRLMPSPARPCIGRSTLFLLHHCCTQHSLPVMRRSEAACLLCDIKSSVWDMDSFIIAHLCGSLLPAVHIERKLAGSRVRTSWELFYRTASC